MGACIKYTLNQNDNLNVGYCYYVTLYVMSSTLNFYLINKIHHHVCMCVVTVVKILHKIETNYIEWDNLCI